MGLSGNENSCFVVVYFLKDGLLNVLWKEEVLWNCFGLGLWFRMD